MSVQRRCEVCRSREVLGYPHGLEVCVSVLEDEMEGLVAALRRAALEACRWPTPCDDATRERKWWCVGCVAKDALSTLAARRGEV